MIGETDKLAFVIPAFNEEKVIESVVTKIVRKLPWAEIVVVDDGSSDSTWQTVQRLPVHRLRHMINLGQGASLQTGISYAERLDVKYIVTFDADGQHRLSDLPRFITKIRDEGYDIVIGSRFLRRKSIRNIPLGRRRLLRAATLFTRLTTGLPVTDTHNGYRVFRVDAAPKLEMRINGMGFAR